MGTMGSDIIQEAHATGCVPSGTLLSQFNIKKNEVHSSVWHI